MAKVIGISPSSVRRIWAGQGLQPHRARAFKLSNDPNFADKLKAVVGRYINPPAHAVVLSIDEKSQIQALDRATDGSMSCRSSTQRRNRRRRRAFRALRSGSAGGGAMPGLPRQQHALAADGRGLGSTDRD
jgi:hypothetical protein